MNNKIRLVGINDGTIFVQIKNNNEWDQKVMTFEEFDEMMKNERPKMYKEYRNSNTELPAARWFYNYRETEEMKLKGIAYEF